jgi:hypothetical protein
MLTLVSALAVGWALNGYAMRSQVAAKMIEIRRWEQRLQIVVSLVENREGWTVTWEDKEITIIAPDFGISEPTD